MPSDKKEPLHPESLDRGKKEKLDEEKSRELAKIFKAFADPTRTKILTALSEKELCVHDLSILLNMSQSAISHQLRVLRDSRIVKFHKEGRRTFYSLDDEHIEKLLNIGIEHINEEWNDVKS